MASRRPLKYDPVRRMTDLVLSQGFPAGFWPDSERAKLAGNDSLGWWIGHLREAEASIQQHRKRLEALRDGIAPRLCPHEARGSSRAGQSLVPAVPRTMR